jgi:hypothetical protein
MASEDEWARAGMRDRDASETAPPDFPQAPFLQWRSRQLATSEQGEDASQDRNRRVAAAHIARRILVESGWCEATLNLSWLRVYALRTSKIAAGKNARRINADE